VSFKCWLQCKSKSTIIVIGTSKTTVLEFHPEIGQNIRWALCIDMCFKDVMDRQADRQTIWYSHAEKSCIKIKVSYGVIYDAAVWIERAKDQFQYHFCVNFEQPMNLTKDKCDWVQHIYQACNSLPRMQKTKNRIKERSCTHKPMKDCSIRLVCISIAIAQNDKHIREKTGEW